MRWAVVVHILNKCLVFAGYIVIDAIKFKQQLVNFYWIIYPNYTTTNEMI